jgi:SNF2 family DNA or RNA helicase
LCLTGTIIRNYCTDIFSQFRFLGFDYIKRHREWKQKGFEINEKLGLTKNLVLTMDYEIANIKLPELKRHVVEVSISGNELRFCQRATNALEDIIEGFQGGFVDYACVLEMFLYLRKTCISALMSSSFLSEKIKIGDLRWKMTDIPNGPPPKHVDSLMRIASNTPAIDSSTTNYNNPPEFRGTLAEWAADIKGTGGFESRKIQEIVNIAKFLILQKKKFLMFSAFSSVISMVKLAIEHEIKNTNLLYVDGTVVGASRTNTLNSFRSNPNVQGMFMTYKVGSEGLNLIEAEAIISVEPWWNQAVHDQAIARAHRTGQTKDVHYYIVIVKGTIEQPIMKMCESKKEMSTAMIAGGKKVATTGISCNELIYMLGELKRQNEKNQDDLPLVGENLQ